MIAILLCAGFGTRMGAADGTPKPLLSVGESSFLDWIAEDLSRAEAVDALHVVANHRHAQQFRAWADVRGPEYEAQGAALHVHDDGVETPDEQRGVVGDLRFVLDRVDVPDDGVCVGGVDSVYRFPLAPIVDAFGGQHSQLLALYEPDEDAQRHSSLLHLDGDRVQAIAPTGAETSPGDDSDGADPYVCPLFALLTSQDVRAVGPYLDAGHDPDDFGPFANTLAQTRRVEAVRLPQRSGLRFHCNTPEALEKARATLRDEPRLQLTERDLAERLAS